MHISIQRIDTSLPLPAYHTNGAVGFDLITRETTTIEPGTIALVPGNVIVKVPEGYALLLVPRSSLPRKKGLICPHSFGVIDQDYHGENDELMVQVQNITNQPVTYHSNHFTKRAAVSGVYLQSLASFPFLM